jgi:hypothetical protein
LNDTVYRSDDVEVRRIRGDADSGIQVVTFHSYHDGNGLDHRGFGELYFTRERMDAIHVLCRGNDWYQYAEMPTITAAIRSAVEGAQRVITYGTSMGGYAAIRFADAIGADIALAISPQYSVDPRKMPSERRWLDDQRRIRFLPGVDGRIRFAGRVIIAYDPELALDRLHVERFEKDVKVEHLPLPHAGHPASTYLHETGILQPLVRSIISNTLNIAAFAENAASLATKSPAYLIQLSASKPSAEAIVLAERAAALAPGEAYVFNALGDRLAAAEDWPRAIDAYRRAVALDPKTAFRWNLAKALTVAQYPDEALSLTRTLQDEAPAVARYHRHAAKLLLARGDKVGALAEVRTAIRCAPADRGHRRAALRLGWQLRRERWFG